MPDARPAALITGASSGIGETFARQLAARGYHVILVARRRDRLEALAAEIKGEALAADLTDAHQRDAVCRRLREDATIELLINNAGFGTKRRFWDADLAVHRQMHELHVTATVDLTHAALGGMVRRGRGAVINVSSIAAFARSQTNVSYCATKAWMVAFTEGLTLELRGLGSPVQVQALCPGFTYSEFHDVMRVDRARIPKSLWMKSDDVVRESLIGLERRKVIVIPGWRYRLFVRFMNVLPWRVRMAMWQGSPHTRGRME